jgi:hypothetical protein
MINHSTNFDDDPLVIPPEKLVLIDEDEVSRSVDRKCDSGNANGNSNSDEFLQEKIVVYMIDD